MTTSDSIHGLEIPLAGMLLVVPSAAVAEVVHLADLASVGGASPWMLGVLAWRSLAVPVMSFEALIAGSRPAPNEHSKIVVFYPLPGRQTREFFALLSTSDPRPRTIDGSCIAAADAELPDTSYVAAGVKFDDRVLCIPDMGALRQALYP